MGGASYGPTWQSPDPILRKLGVKYLHVGGDWWNRCHGGTWARDAAAAARDGTGASWLNIDEAFSSEKMGSLTANQIATDDKGGHNMMVAFRADTRLPFLSNSVQLIYTEHMLEHLIPMQGGVAFVRELYRLLVPGGVLRLSTPDLALYMCAYVRPPAGLRRHRHFLRSHGNRFAPDRAYQLGDEYISDASVVNNIFRNYGHQHVYDFDEFLRAAELAGVNASAVCRSDLEARGLPPPLRRAVRRATEPANGSLACWLDQKVRSDESLYVHLQKGEAWPQPHRTGVDQNGRAPFCQPVPGDWGPCII